MTHFLPAFFLPFFGFGLAMYFLPSLIALGRNKRDVTAIVLLNFFLGWTMIGWVVALVWAVKARASADFRSSTRSIQSFSTLIAGRISRRFRSHIDRDHCLVRLSDIDTAFVGLHAHRAARSPHCG